MFDYYTRSYYPVDDFNNLLKVATLAPQLQCFSNKMSNEFHTLSKSKSLNHIQTFLHSANGPFFLHHPCLLLEIWAIRIRDICVQKCSIDSYFPMST